MFGKLQPELNSLRFRFATVPSTSPTGFLLAALSHGFLLSGGSVLESQGGEKVQTTDFLLLHEESLTSSTENLSSASDLSSKSAAESKRYIFLSLLIQVRLGFTQR